MASKSADSLSCRETRRLLTAYVERELDNATGSGVQAHLARCEACREEERRNREALGLLASAPRVTAPETIRIEVMALVRAEDRRRQAARPLRWAAAAACMFLVIGASALLVQRATSPVKPEKSMPPVNPVASYHGNPTPKSSETVPSGRDRPNLAPALPQAKSAAPAKRVASAPSTATVGFLDVKAKDGFSARDKIALRRRALTPLPLGAQLIGQGVPVPGTSSPEGSGYRPPAAVEYSPPYREPLEVEHPTPVVRTEASYDRRGNLAVIRVRVERDDSERSDEPTDARK